jgi:excisionase family DNA binding protein
MPYRTFGIEEVAQYLHLHKADVERMVKDNDIPFEKHGRTTVFRKGDIDAWASKRILGLHGSRLDDYHHEITHGSPDTLPHEALIPQLSDTRFMEPALAAKTKASVIRAMADLARKTGRVLDPGGLLEELQAREDLCSTGIPGGVALLHPRHPDPYLFDNPFIVLGRTIQSVPFGAPDGQPTDLFFLLACPDDRIHLHALARLCLMAQKTELLEQLRRANDASGMYNALIDAEEVVLVALPATHRRR